MPAILCHIALDRDLIAYFHRRARPATANQSSRAVCFQSPIQDSAGTVLDVTVKANVEVRPTYCQKKARFPKLLEAGLRKNENYEESAATVVCSHACPIHQHDAVGTTTNGSGNKSHQTQCKRAEETMSRYSWVPVLKACRNAENNRQTFPSLPSLSSLA